MTVLIFMSGGGVGWLVYSGFPFTQHYLTGDIRVDFGVDE